MSDSMPMPRLYLWLLLLFAAIGLARLLVHPPSAVQAHDLRVPWTGARLLAEGENPLDGQAMQATWRRYVPFDSNRLVPGSPEMPAIYPPPAYALYLPLGILPFHTAWGVNLLVMLVSIAAIVWFTRSILLHYGHDAPAGIILLLLFALKGSSNAFAVGQPTFLAMALSLGAWHHALQQRTVRAGLLAGLALFKFTVVLPVFVWMLWTRRFKSILWAGLVCLLLCMPVVYTAGWDWPLHYLRNAAVWRDFCFDAGRPGFPLVYELSALTEVRVLAALHPLIPAWLPALLVLPSLLILFLRYRHDALRLYAVACLGSLLLLQHLYYDVAMLLPLGIVWLQQRPAVWQDWLIIGLLTAFFLPVNRLLDFFGIESAFLYMHNAWVLVGLGWLLAWRFERWSELRSEPEARTSARTSARGH